MNWAVEQPWLLAGLMLLLLPLFNSGLRPRPQPYLSLLPADGLSLAMSALLKLMAMAALASLVLGLAGLHRTEQSRERIGHGAHIVLLLDRSSSMDNTFAGQAANGKEEAKAVVAKRLLTEFVAGRQQDLIGVAAYSTAPLFVIPLTENKQAVQAAIAATSTPALSYTHVSKGLGMALSFFNDQPLTGSRMVVLVSDGAAAISSDDEQKLRLWFKAQQVRLYWIFLRTAGSPGIFDKPQDSRDDNAQAMPELYLHKFFSSLETPYQAFEAENPSAMAEAIAAINRLENLPLQYRERIPKLDLSGLCYQLASLFIAVLFGAHFFEVKR